MRLKKNEKKTQRIIDRQRVGSLPFFPKINMTDNSVVHLTNERERRPKWIKSEIKREVTLGPDETRENFENLGHTKLKNPGQMNKFLDVYVLLKLYPEDINKFNGVITITGLKQ